MNSWLIVVVSLSLLVSFALLGVFIYSVVVPERLNVVVDYTSKPNPQSHHQGTSPTRSAPAEVTERTERIEPMGPFATYPNVVPKSMLLPTPVPLFPSHPLYQELDPQFPAVRLKVGTDWLLIGRLTSVCGKHVLHLEGRISDRRRADYEYRARDVDNFYWEVDWCDNSRRGRELTCGDMVCLPDFGRRKHTCERCMHEKEGLRFKVTIYSECV